MDRRERSILAVTVTGHALTHVCEQLFPATALLVTAGFFGAEGKYEAIGLAAFVFRMLFGAAALPSGWLVDRLGPRRVLLIQSFGTGAGVAMLAAAPDYALFTSALAFLGLFAGLYHPAGTTLITFGVREQGRALGIHGVGGNLGLAVTPFLAAAVAAAVGWRWAYAAFAAPPLVLGLIVLSTGLGNEERPGDSAQSTAPAERETEAPARRTAVLALIFAMAAFNGMTYAGFMTFIPAYFAENVHLARRHLSAGVVGGSMTTAVLLLGVLGQYVGGSLADRMSKEKLYAAIFFVAAPVLFMIGRLTELPLVAAAGGFAFLYFMNQPVGNALVAAHTAARVRGVVFGLFFFMSFGAGSVMSPIAGWVGTHFELRSIFAMLAGSILLSSVLGLGLIRTAPAAPSAH